MRAATLAALLLATPAAAVVQIEGEAAGAEVLGSARTFTIWTTATDVDAMTHLARLRLKGQVWWGDVELAVAGDAVVATRLAGAKGQASFQPIAAPTTLRLVDLGGQHQGDNYALTPDLDRLVLSWTAPNGMQVRLGRQAIGHGGARVFPTTDVFAPLTALTLDTEYKRGVDAARFTAPLGGESEVELYAVGNEDDAAEGLYLARVRASVAEILDVSALGGYSRGALSLGLDLQGDLLGAGWYAEVWSRPGDGRAGLRATAGASYKLADWALKVTAEAHYNGAGGTPQADVYADGEAFFRDRLYTALIFDYAWTPLLKPRLAWFQNLEDGSAILGPALGWSLADEAAVNLGGFIGLGERSGELARASVLFGDLRVYF